MKNKNWYHALNQPKFAPPDWIFTPIWLILYTMILTSMVIFLKTGNVTENTIPLSLYIIQFILNLSWTPLFFGMKNMGGALIVNILLWVCILSIIIIVFPISKIASILLIPYLLWVSFAIYLNTMYWKLN